MKMQITGKMRDRRVFVNGQELKPHASQAVHDHSPDGFCWGYGGSGPAQLALALLMHAGLPRTLVLHRYQDFKREIVAGLPDDFDITVEVKDDGSWAKL
jgi:hypothetical protein